jgi:hypothetical protein
MVEAKKFKMKPSLMHRIRQLASVVTSRAGLAAKAGVTFGGDRELYEALGYKENLETSDHRSRYERDGIASQIVDAFPKATWRGDIKVVDDINPEVITPFQEEWEALEERLKIFSILLRGDKLAGLGQFSVILLGVPGDLASPISSIGSSDKLFYLTAYSQLDVTVDTYNEDNQNIRFGQPETYKFTRLGSGEDQEERIVHYTRIIHIADNVIDEISKGVPRLQQPWNRLDDLDKVTGGGSEAFWLRAHQGYQVDLEPDIELNDDEQAALSTEIDSFINKQRRVVQTRGVKMNSLGSDVANFAEQADSILTQISGGTGIPKRILLGSERGELASTQDRENWNERVGDRRLQFAEPFILRPFIDRLIEFNALPKPTDDKYTIVWPKMQSTSQKEKAEIADTLSGVNSKAGGIVVVPSEIREQILDLPPVDESLEDIEDDDNDVNPDAEPTEEEVEEGTLAAAQKKSSLLWMNHHKRNRG